MELKLRPFSKESRSREKERDTQSIGLNLKPKFNIKPNIDLRSLATDNTETKIKSHPKFTLDIKPFDFKRKSKATGQSRAH